MGDYMKLVLLSGGSGTRLWPLSNDARSKQFLKILDNENKEMESMVQRVWNQINSVGLSKSSVIATSKTQVEMIESQLGIEVPVVVEPERRDTFPAIALAASYLFSVMNVGLDEVVGVLPVDPYVEDHFFEKVKELEEAVIKTGADLALIGVQPTYPSEKYGYIVPKKEESQENIKNVSHFREKPSEDQAEMLIKDNAMWNCGVFAFKLEYIINMLVEKELPLQYEVLLEQYTKLPKISFDYEVVEKATKIIALPYQGYWKDLGTWNTLTEEMSTNVIGNGILSDDSKDSHLINELEIPVTVMGLSDVIVAASPDGILISDKSASPKIKDLVSDLKQRPMFEEKRWGSYKVLDQSNYPEGEVLTKKIWVDAGKSLSYQYHHQRKEVWTIISGKGEIILDGEMKKIQAGDVIEIFAGMKHSIKAITDLEFIEVQTGSVLLKEDINRITFNWDEMKKSLTV